MYRNNIRETCIHAVTMAMPPKVNKIGTLSLLTKWQGSGLSVKGHTEGERLLGSSHTAHCIAKIHSSLGYVDIAVLEVAKCVSQIEALWAVTTTQVHPRLVSCYKYQAEEANIPHSHHPSFLLTNKGEKPTIPSTPHPSFSNKPKHSLPSLQPLPFQ